MVWGVSASFRKPWGVGAILERGLSVSLKLFRGVYSLKVAVAWVVVHARMVAGVMGSNEGRRTRGMRNLLEFFQHKEPRNDVISTARGEATPCGVL